MARAQRRKQAMGQRHQARPIQGRVQAMHYLRQQPMHLHLKHLILLRRYRHILRSRELFTRLSRARLIRRQAIQEVRITRISGESEQLQLMPARAWEIISMGVIVVEIDIIKLQKLKAKSSLDLQIRAFFVSGQLGKPCCQSVSNFLL